MALYVLSIYITRPPLANRTSFSSKYRIKTAGFLANSLLLNPFIPARIASKSLYFI